MAPNCRVYFDLYHHACAVKIRPVSLENILYGTVKVTSFIKSLSFKYSDEGKMHMKHFCGIPECSGWLQRESTWEAAFFIEHHFFSKGHLTNWLFKIGYLADSFLKMDTVSLLLQGKQLIVFVANNKNSNVNWNFWKVVTWTVSFRASVLSLCVLTFLAVLGFKLRSSPHVLGKSSASEPHPQL